MDWRRFFRRNQADAELEQEIDLYLAEEIDENVARGMSLEQATRQARLKFGNPRQVRENLWQQNTVSLIDNAWRASPASSNPTPGNASAKMDFNPRRISS